MILSWLMMNYQNSLNLNMYMLIYLNNLINLIMMLIINFIIYLIMFMIMNKKINKFLFENNIMEFYWSILPSMIIIFFSFFSIKILYLNNEKKINLISIKIISNQWFWYYEYLNLNKNFNSYMLYKKNFHFNIIETDNNLILPFNYFIQLFISSFDVIHSWTIPSLNFKIDSIPNQINSKYLMINKPSIMFGQCSEICGINHSFMPIKIESIKMMNFIKWLKLMEIFKN